MCWVWRGGGSNLWRGGREGGIVSGWVGRVGGKEEGGSGANTGNGE